MDEVRHFLVWVAEKDPREREQVPADGAVDKRALHPLRHVTRQRHLRNCARPGDVLWFVRRLGRLGLPPALDARLTIAFVSGTDRLEFTAGPDSAWLPWRNGRAVLQGLGLTSRIGRQYLDLAIAGQSLQTTRRIDGATEAAKVQNFAQNTQARPRAFVSYAWRDGRLRVPEAVQWLEDQGFSVWFDLWSGPRRLANGVEAAPDGRIQAMLGGAIDQSDIFVVLDSPSYGKSCWVRTEVALARDLGKPIHRL